MASLFRDSNRLEAFSDGVFAIAITLLILDIRAPQIGERAGPATPWAGLGQLWPSYLAYALAFSTILIAWVGHHLVIGQVKHVTQRLLFVNGLFLLSISFLPFPTSVVAEQLRSASASAVAFYALANLLVSLTFYGLSPRTRPSAAQPEAQVVVGPRVVPALRGAGPAQPGGVPGGGRGAVGLVDVPAVREAGQGALTFPEPLSAWSGRR